MEPSPSPTHTSDPSLCNDPQVKIRFDPSKRDVVELSLPLSVLTSSQLGSILSAVNVQQQQEQQGHKILVPTSTLTQQQTAESSMHAPDATHLPNDQQPSSLTITPPAPRMTADITGNQDERNRQAPNRRKPLTITSNHDDRENLKVPTPTRVSIGSRSAVAEMWENRAASPLAPNALSARRKATGETHRDAAPDSTLRQNFTASTSSGLAIRGVKVKPDLFNKKRAVRKSKLNVARTSGKSQDKTVDITLRRSSDRSRSALEEEVELKSSPNFLTPTWQRPEPNADDNEKDESDSPTQSPQNSASFSVKALAARYDSTAVSRESDGPDFNAEIKASEHERYEEPIQQQVEPVQQQIEPVQQQIEPVQQQIEPMTEPPVHDIDDDQSLRSTVILKDSIAVIPRNLSSEDSDTASSTPAFEASDAYPDVNSTSVIDDLPLQHNVSPVRDSPENPVHMYAPDPPLVMPITPPRGPTAFPKRAMSRSSQQVAAMNQHHMGDPQGISDPYESVSPEDASNSSGGTANSLRDSYETPCETPDQDPQMSHVEAFASSLTPHSNRTQVETSNEYLPRPSVEQLRLVSDREVLSDSPSKEPIAQSHLESFDEGTAMERGLPIHFDNRSDDRSLRAMPNVGLNLSEKSCRTISSPDFSTGEAAAKKSSPTNVLPSESKEAYMADRMAVEKSWEGIEYQLQGSYATSVSLRHPFRAAALWRPLAYHGALKHMLCLGMNRQKDEFHKVRHPSRKIRGPFLETRIQDLPEKVIDQVSKFAREEGFEVWRNGTDSKLRCKLAGNSSSVMWMAVDVEPTPDGYCLIRVRRARADRAKTDWWKYARFHRDVIARLAEDTEYA